MENKSARCGRGACRERANNGGRLRFALTRFRSSGFSARDACVRASRHDRENLSVLAVTVAQALGLDEPLSRVGLRSGVLVPPLSRRVWVAWEGQGRPCAALAVNAVRWKRRSVRRAACRARHGGMRRGGRDL